MLFRSELYISSTGMDVVLTELTFPGKEDWQQPIPAHPELLSTLLASVQYEKHELTMGNSSWFLPLVTPTTIASVAQPTDVNLFLV